VPYQSVPKQIVPASRIRDGWGLCLGGHCWARDFIGKLVRKDELLNRGRARKFFSTLLRMPTFRREAGGRLYFSHILFSDVTVLMGLAVVPPHRTNAALADPREYFGPPRTYRRFGIE
jgi:hypothetical protein